MDPSPSSAVPTLGYRDRHQRPERQSRPPRPEAHRHRPSENTAVSEASESRNGTSAISEVTVESAGSKRPEKQSERPQQRQHNYKAPEFHYHDAPEYQDKTGGLTDSENDTPSLTGGIETPEGYIGQVLDDKFARYVGDRLAHSEAGSASEVPASKNGTAGYQMSCDRRTRDTETSRGWDENSRSTWSEIYRESKSQDPVIRQEWRNDAFGTYAQIRNRETPRAVAKYEAEQQKRSRSESTYTSANDEPQERSNQLASAVQGFAIPKPWDMQPIDRYAKAKAAPADSQPPQDQGQVLDEQSERSIGGRSPHNEAMSASQESMSRNGTADYDTSYDTTKLDTATSRGWDEPSKDFWTRVYASSKRQSCQIRQQWRDMAYDTYVQGRNLNKAAAEAEYQDTTSSHPSSTYTAASDGPQEQRNHDAARTSGSAFFKPWDPQSKHHFARYMADAEQLPLEEGLKSMNDRVSNYVGRRLEVEAKSAFEHAQSTAHSVRESQHSRDRYLGRTQQEWFQFLLQRSKDTKRRKSSSKSTVFTSKPTLASIDDREDSSEAITIAKGTMTSPQSVTQSDAATINAPSRRPSFKGMTRANRVARLDQWKLKHLVRDQGTEKAPETEGFTEQIDGDSRASPQDQSKTCDASLLTERGKKQSNSSIVTVIRYKDLSNTEALPEGTNGSQRALIETESKTGGASPNDLHSEQDVQSHPLLPQSPDADHSKEDGVVDEGICMTYGHSDPVIGGGQTGASWIQHTNRHRRFGSGIPMCKFKSKSPEVDVIGSPPDRDNSISFRDRTEGSGAKIVEIKFRGDWTTIMSSRYSLAELGKLTAPPTANDASLSIKPPGDHAPTPSTAVRFSSRIPRPSAVFFSRETWPPSQTDPVSEQSTSEAVQSTPESSPGECNRYGATSAPPTPTHQGYHESMSRASRQSSRASTNSETALVYPDPEESPISLSMFPQRLSPKISTSYQSHQTSSPSRPPQPPPYESLGDNDCNAQTILTGDNTALFGRAGAGGWQIYNKRWFGADAVLNGENRRERLTATVFSEWPTEIWTNAPHSANFELSTAGSEVPPAYSKVEGPSEGKSRLSKITSGFSLHVKSKLPTHIRHFPHAASTYLQDRALRRVKSTSPVSVDPTSHLTNGGAKYSSSEPPVCFATIRPDLKDYSDSIPNDEFYDDSRDAEQDGATTLADYPDCDKSTFAKPTVAEFLSRARQWPSSSETPRTPTSNSDSVSSLSSDGYFSEFSEGTMATVRSHWVHP